MTTRKFMVISLIAACSHVALGSSDKSCARIQDRVFEVSGSYTILGDKWLWTDANVIVDRTDPAFKEEVINAFKRENQWDEVKEGFDQAFKANSPEFMGIQFMLLASSRTLNGGIGYKDSRWLYLDRSYICKTTPLECFEIGNTSGPLVTQKKKAALSKFFETLEKNRIKSFCSDIAKKSDAIFLGYSSKASKCSKPKWASLDQYCSSIEKAYEEVAAALL